MGSAVESVKSAVTGRAAGLVGVAAAGVVTGLAANLARKAIVQAPSALAGDWLEALKVEHRLALGLFDLLQATGNEEPSKRSALLVQLKHALGKHAFTEENVIYPALRSWGDKADADKLNHDHGYVKQYLYELEDMDNASPAFLEKVAAFRADLEAHIEEEEAAIFPPLHAALGDAGNAKVTALANKEGFKLA
jgi:hemerythrin superfamily protein